MLDDKDDPRRITIDNVGDLDALRIYVRVGKDGIHYNIGIETWLKDYLTTYNDARKDLIEGLIDGINRSIDE